MTAPLKRSTIERRSPRDGASVRAAPEQPFDPTRGLQARPVQLAMCGAPFGVVGA